MSQRQLHHSGIMLCAVVFDDPIIVKNNRLFKKIRLID
jgi:hypothetical protein